MENKTLKDLVLVYEEDTARDVAVKTEILAEIKAEAIKWVKEDRKEFGVTFQGEFWQHRLNITEKDLEEFANEGVEE